MTTQTRIPEQGEPAPQFCLPDASETRVCLNELAGKWVVLYFYPRDNTSGCTTEALEFTAAQADFEKLNAVVLGVSKDSAASHQKFIAKHGLGVRLLTDPEKEVLQLYGAWRMKKCTVRKAWALSVRPFLSVRIR